MCEEYGKPDAVCTVAEFNLSFFTAYLARTVLDARYLRPCTQTHDSHRFTFNGFLARVLAPSLSRLSALIVDYLASVLTFVSLFIDVTYLKL